MSSYDKHPLIPSKANVGRPDALVMTTASPAAVPGAACTCIPSIALLTAPLCVLPSQTALPSGAIEIEKHDSTRCAAEYVTSHSELHLQSRLRALLKICLPPTRKAQPRLTGAIIEPVILAGCSLSPYKWDSQWVGIPSRCGATRCESVWFYVTDPVRRVELHLRQALGLPLIEHVDEARGHVSEVLAR